MAIELDALCIDAHDPVAVARFWSGLLGWERTDDARDDLGGVTLRPNDDTGFLLRFVPSAEPRRGPNQLHPDLTSTSLTDQRRTVERALALGATHLDVGQRPEEGHVVLADPEGNELCVLGPGNAFLADCGFFGALAGGGSRATGCFWSAALGWPLVWDQGEETAVRSPHGGPKITWGGPPLSPRNGKERVHLEVRPSADSSGDAELERLLSLGATRADIGQGEVAWVVLADPDGHELCLLPPR